MKKNFYLKTDAGAEIFIRSWKVDAPIAVVQIIHGMAEHSARYEELACFFNENKISVYAADHRGHGKTISDISEKGIVGKNGVELMSDDQAFLTELIKKTNKNVPVFILGHSMGSFISQRVLEKNTNFNIKGLILSGSSGSFGLSLTMGKQLAKFITFLKKDNPSPLLDFLTFLSYNKKTEKNTKYDWLCSDKNMVAEYIKDPLCGGVLSANFYYSLFSLINNTLKNNNLKKINNSLPILIISGDFDPLGKYGKGVMRLYRRYESLGFKDLHMKLYENARHEILNEKNKYIVYKDVLCWIKKHIGH